MRILVGIDEFPESSATLRSAIALADGLGAELTVVHAVPFAQPAAFDVPDFSAVRRDALRSLTPEVQKRVREWSQGTSWEGRDPGSALVVRAGQPAQVLAKEAEERGADLLLIGPHRKHGLLDFGNTMRNTLAAAHTSVWVQIGEWKQPKRILAPIDLSPVATVVLERARDLARAFGAKVEVLYCFPVPLFGYPSSWPEPAVMPTYVIDDVRKESRQSFEQLLSGFDWQGVEHEPSFVEADPVAHIHDAAAGFDLIVMGQHGEGWISATVLGSTAYAVLKHAPCSILALRHHRDD